MHATGHGTRSTCDDAPTGYCCAISQHRSIFRRAIARVARLARISTRARCPKSDLALASGMHGHGQFAYSSLRKRSEISLARAGGDGGRRGASSGPKKRPEFRARALRDTRRGRWHAHANVSSPFQWVIQEMFLIGAWDRDLDLKSPVREGSEPGCKVKPLLGTHDSWLIHRFLPTARPTDLRGPRGSTPQQPPPRRGTFPPSPPSNRMRASPVPRKKFANYLGCPREVTPEGDVRPGVFAG